MNFDLRRPCKDCPFRTDIPGFLSKARAREITRAITDGQGTFSCHKLNDFTEDDEGEPVVIEGDKAQHCAGALIFLERINRPNQMMRIAERLRLYDRTKLDMDAPVFASATAMIKAQPR